MACAAGDSPVPLGLGWGMFYTLGPIVVALLVEPKAGIVESQGQFFTQGFLNHRVQ